MLVTGYKAHVRHSECCIERGHSVGVQNTHVCSLELLLTPSDLFQFSVCVPAIHLVYT